MYGPVAYVDYKTGATEVSGNGESNNNNYKPIILLQGYVRFRESGCVEKLTKAEEKLLEGVTFEAVNGKSVIVYTLVIPKPQCACT